jgi:predicted nucleotidyltransferase
LFRSDHQLSILAALFLYGGEWTISELAQHADAPMATASREVHRLVNAGLVSLEPRGQLRLVRANLDLPWAAPLVELLDQTVGPIHHLRAQLDDPGWAGIDEAYVFGSWARRYRGEAGPQPNDLDLVLITAEPMPAGTVLRFQRQLEARIHMPVDAFAVTPDAWSRPSDQALRALQDGPIVRVGRLMSDGGDE